jgi:methylated-DNA-[protein]-cysteine S-methyltransferase
MRIMSTTFVSPIGMIRLSARNGRLCALDIGNGEMEAEDDGDEPLLREAVAQLRAWFDRRLVHFALPLSPAGTPRGPAHRAAIMAIGYGETASYGEVARAIGSSPRAVGQACARNPLPIIVPCHRVLGADGAIGHYSAGGGIATKCWLLSHEKGH